MESNLKRVNHIKREVAAIVTRASKLPRNAVRCWWLMMSHSMCLRSRGSSVREERFRWINLSMGKML